MGVNQISRAASLLIYSRSGTNVLLERRITFRIEDPADRYADYIVVFKWVAYRSRQQRGPRFCYPISILLKFTKKNPKLAIKAAIEFATDRLRYAIPDTGHATQDTRYAIREIEEKEPGDRTPDKRAKANTSKGSV